MLPVELDDEPIIVAEVPGDGPGEIPVKAEET